MTSSTGTRVEHLQVDLLVIGWGKAGKTLAGVLARRGQRVAMVEQSPQMYGGTCINIACVPTKILVHDAEQRRPDDDPRAYFARARDRRDGLTGAMRARNFEMLDTLDTVTVITGRARFVGPSEVEVTAGSDVVAIEADVIVVNTGSVPVVPPIPGLALGGNVHDSTSLQAIDHLPEHLLVLGAGPIGIEFAGMFARFGAKVTLVDQADRLLPNEDDDVAAVVTESLESAGVEIVPGAEATGVEAGSSGVTLAVRRDGAEESLSGSMLLVATGRRPATDGLDLEVAGVDVDERGAIVVDAHLRSSNPRVWAVGDVNGGPQFTSISFDDHRIVLDHLVGEGRRSVDDRVAVPTTTFSTPPLSRVGVTEREARAHGHDILVAAKPVADIATMPRPKIVGDPAGILKFVVDAETDLVLGAALCCVDSQELVNTVALAMRHDVTATQLRDGIWIHPSTTEGLNEVLGSLA